MISITLPDGNIKAFDQAVSGRELAASISDGLARNCVAMELDHRLVDLDTRVDRDASVRLVTTQDPTALEIMRHSAAHVMAGHPAPIQGGEADHRPGGRRGLLLRHRHAAGVRGRLP